MEVAGTGASDPADPFVRHEGETTMAARRATHRSTAGKKLYAVRDTAGKFKDIQSYEKAHRQDITRKSKAERKPKK